MTTAKEKLAQRLLEGNDDIFTEFVIVGLENSLETICQEVERLIKVKNLKDSQQTDLNELIHDGKAITRVLKCYTGYEYEPESLLMHHAFDKLLGEVF